MNQQVYHATPANLPEVHKLLAATFNKSKLHEPGDPGYRPGQFIFRRRRGKAVSALKVYLRQLHHPGGAVPVTLIGGVCTREDLRGRGLIAPVIAESLRYSRKLGAKAQLIVTPRRNYYLRHGYRYFKTAVHAGALPDLTLRGARVELLRQDDAPWMTELYGAQRFAYGPMVRNEDYVRFRIVAQAASRPGRIGLKLLRKGEPVAYLVAGIGAEEKGSPDLRVLEAVSRAGDGAYAAVLLSFLRSLQGARFVCNFPDDHPLVRFLRRRGRLKRTTEERFMYYALDDSFPMPGENFYFSFLDFV